MPMLNSVLSLHDVANVEAFCHRAIRTQMRRLRMPSSSLTPTEHEEALAYVVAECWILAERYDPALTPSFSTYAYHKCQLRFVNWLHTKLGRNPERQPPVSLEAYVERVSGRDTETGATINNGDWLTDSAAHVLVDPRADDPADCRSADLVRLLRSRGSASADEIDKLGEAAEVRAA